MERHRHPRSAAKEPRAGKTCNKIRKTVMVYSGLKYFHQYRRVQRDLYYQFGISKVELELLTSLVILIVGTGKVQHAKEPIMRKAMQPRRNGQFLASFQSLINSGYIIQVRSGKGHAYRISDEGLMIIERYDMQLTELAEGETKVNKTVSEVLSGALN